MPSLPRQPMRLASATLLPTMSRRTQMWCAWWKVAFVVVLMDELGYLEDIFIYDSTSAISVPFMMLDDRLLVENLI